ncbi:hypothetical protein Q3G72_021478 [Acer saccharum]|nr:hypothetical protein Q3G72_021478 [Acer saccharum]
MPMPPSISTTSNNEYTNTSPSQSKVKRALDTLSFLFLLLHHRSHSRTTMILLAASAQNKCTALVCSCYVPSRNFNSRHEESNNRSCKKLFSAAEKNSDEQELPYNNNNYKETQQLVQEERIASSNSEQQFMTLKSNLKKTTVVEENHIQLNTQTQRRKVVTWSDAHGKDIAHVQEFQPSVSDDGELEGVRNSCVCTIQ